MLLEDLSKYSLLTLYEEERDCDRLLFNKGISFDEVGENENNPRFIDVRQSKSNGRCMIDRNLEYEIKQLDFNRDMIAIGNNAKKIIFFCKKL